MEFTEWWQPHLHWFWVMPFLFMVLMCIFAAGMMRRACSWRWASENRAAWGPLDCRKPRWAPSQGLGSETPRQILDRRYASGEITRDQYERIKRDLEESSTRSEPGADDRFAREEDKNPIGPTFDDVRNP